MRDIADSNNRLVIVDSPTFIWFVNSIIVGIAIMGFVRDGTPWWANAFFGSLACVVLINHHTFRTRSTIDGDRREVTIERWTLFGKRTHVVGGEDLVDLGLKTQIWGDSGNRQRRYSLKLLSRNLTVDILDQTADKDLVDARSARIRELLDLPERDLESPPDALPPAADDVVAAVTSALSQLADKDNFKRWNELDDDVRAKVTKAMRLQDGDDGLLYVDTGVIRKGRVGLLVGRNGLYWHNDPVMDAHTRRSRVSWEDFASGQWREDPNDDDILMDGALQVSLAGLTNPEDVKALFAALHDALNAGT